MRSKYIIIRSLNFETGVHQLKQRFEVDCCSLSLSSWTNWVHINKQVITQFEVCSLILKYMKSFWSILCICNEVEVL